MSETQPTPPLHLEQPSPGNDPLIGQKVGEFVIEAPIAAGGMGIVYRAVHPLIGRRVAIKVVRPEMMSDKEQADRFLKEAQALSAIKHRGIIEVIGFGNLADGRQYMVMEFLEGESLEAVMDREGSMSAARALPLIDEILSGLGAAHKVGVVHRDLKPSNVFISLATSGERNVKVLDFGLAKHAPVAFEGMVGEVGAKSSLMAGTPEYIAPEQARGLAATPQTDLYCLGVMLFEMLSGELPFAAPNVVDLMRKHVYEAPPRLSSRVSGLPESLDALVAVLLEKNPEDRPASADVARQTVTRILRELREQSTRQATNPFLPEAGPSAGAAAAAAGAVAVVAKATGAAAMVTSKLPDRVRSETQPVDLRDRTPLVALALVLLFLLGGAGGLWLYNRSSSTVEVLAPPALTNARAIEPVIPLAPVVPLVPESQPVMAAVPGEDLAALHPGPPKPVRPPKVVVKFAAESARPWLLMAPGCTPDARWREDAMRTLRELGEYAAKDQRKWKDYQRKEGGLTKAINAASESVECGQTSQQIGELTDAVLRQ
jgi:serine/threonine protein kinase